jgi:hypothetical protein
MNLSQPQPKFPLCTHPKSKATKTFLFHFLLTFAPDLEQKILFTEHCAKIELNFMQNVIYENGKFNILIYDIKSNPCGDTNTCHWKYYDDIY